jgi:DNA invertase Pin-like site-specific DNA recombinase
MSIFPPERPHVVYLRVSTDKQGARGLGMDAQRAAVSAYLARQAGPSLAEFVEVESGRRADRPELAAALTLCRQKKAVLVIAKLDRLSRNLAFIANLMDSGVEFVAVDMPYASRLTLHILAAVAEHERHMISERTKAALRAAKARGVRLGRPDRATSQATAGRRAQSARFATAMLPVVTALRGHGMTLHRIAEQMNARGLQTCHGGYWRAQHVSHLLKRAGASDKKAI